MVSVELPEELSKRSIRRPRKGMLRQSAARRRIAVVLALMALVTGAVMPSAGADPYNIGGSEGGRVPDNWDHTFCISGTFPSSVFWHAVYGMANMDDQSGPFYDTHVGNCTSTTDVIITYANDSSWSAYGQYVCDDFNSAGECEQARIWLNDPRLTYDYQWKSISCHETGHTGGLTHSPNSCMTKYGYDVTTAYWFLLYHQDHVNHLNCRC